MLQDRLGSSSSLAVSPLNRCMKVKNIKQIRTESGMDFLVRFQIHFGQRHAAFLGQENCFSHCPVAFPKRNPFLDQIICKVSGQEILFPYDRDGCSESG